MDACTLYAIVSEDFARLVEALSEAFDKENEAFERVDRTFNEVLNESDVVKYTVPWYLPNGNPIVWYELAPGEVIPAAPEPLEGYYCHPYPSVMPDHDLDIIPEPIRG